MEDEYDSMISIMPGDHIGKRVNVDSPFFYEAYINDSKLNF